MRRFRKRRGGVVEENTDVNLSPLLDMVFILLIFFVVTTTFTRETGVDVKRPKADSSREIEDKVLKVAITREGTVHIFEKQVDLNALETILSREFTRDPSVKLVILADQYSVTEKLVDVIDRANQVGISSTSVATLNP